MDRSNQEEPHNVVISTQHTETIEGYLQKRQLRGILIPWRPNCSMGGMYKLIEEKVISKILAEGVLKNEQPV